MKLIKFSDRINADTSGEEDSDDDEETSKGHLESVSIFIIELYFPPLGHSFLLKFSQNTICIYGRGNGNS